MFYHHEKRTARGLLSLALLLALVAPALAQRLVTIPLGSVIPLRMDTALSSNSSRVGDRFTATVFRSVVVDGRVALPEGTKVEGHVTGINTGDRARGRGAIAVAFDTIALPNNTATPIDATLTTLSEQERSRIEQDVRSPESGLRARRAVVFLGVSGGAGATIGVADGGAEATTVGAILGTLLGNGERAEVRSGAEFGIMVERSFSVDTNTQINAGDRVFNDRNNGGQSQNVLASRVFTSTESIRFAQITLKDRGYYTGPINGVMNQALRNAIRQLQRDRNLSLNGDLDLSTARELGIASDSGIESAAIEIINPRAERIGAGSIRISADVQTQGSGWQVFVNRFVTGNTLHVYVRGVPPRHSSGSARNNHPFTETYNDLPNVARVIIHGPQRDFAADLSGDRGGAVGATGVGNPRQIALLANRLLQDFQRDLNIRNTRGQVIFDTRRGFKPGEVDVLFQIASLQAASELYNQLTASTTDPDAVKGAVGGLMRQSRLLERILRRDGRLALSSIVSADWQQLQAELARVSFTDANLDAEALR